MKPSEVRGELLSQHDAVRGRLDAARGAAGRWVRGEAPWSHVRDELARLSDELRAHNRCEERALTELIHLLDLRGPDRVRLSADEHAREHDALQEALLRIDRSTAPGGGLRELERFSERLLAHMSSEERAFLNEAVLRDDDN